MQYLRYRLSCKDVDVLVVDDNEMNLSVTGGLLKRQE